MKKHYVVIVDLPFSKRDYNRYGIEVLKENFSKVEIWDLSIIFNNHIYDIVKRNGQLAVHEEVQLLTSKKEVLKSITATNKDTFFISTFRYSFRTCFIFRALKKYGLEYGSVGRYVINTFAPVIPRKKAGDTKKKFNPVRIFKKLIHGLTNKTLKASIKLGWVNRVKYFPVAGGQKAYVSSPLVGEKTLVENIHSHDYDTYLSMEQEPSNESYILFIDQYLPFHPDFILSKSTAIKNVEKYFKGLRNIFEKLEEKYKMPVLIGAHPKADYKGREHLFGNRKIVYGNHSGDLIRKCNLALTHFSVAVNFAVLYEKPVLVLTNGELENGTTGDQCYTHSVYLKAPFINIDKDYELPQNIGFDKDAYSDYKDNFIKTPGTPEVNFWQLISERINAFS
jgi:hypothetical protein